VFIDDRSCSFLIWRQQANARFPIWSRSKSHIGELASIDETEITKPVVKTLCWEPVDYAFKGKEKVKERARSAVCLSAPDFHRRSMASQYLSAKP
jgi:hypothetical protein